MVEEVYQKAIALKIDAGGANKQRKVIKRSETHWGHFTMLKAALKYNIPFGKTPGHDIPETSWGVALGRMDENE